MKRVAKFAWSFIATSGLAFFFFFFLIEPARAPQGGKNRLGGRTIASIQEQEFDHRLLQFNLCYGVKFSAERATLERRRVCKAMVVHKLEAALGKPGASFKGPMDFQCEDTVFVRQVASDGTGPVILKPNNEFEAMDKAIASALEMTNVGESTDQFARDACEFLTNCKIAMSQLSLRKTAACFSTGNITHRKILLDEVGTMIFRPRSARTKALYADLLQEAHSVQ